MNKNGFAKRVAVAAGFFFLCAAPGLIRAQSSPASPVVAPQRPSPVARSKKNMDAADDFAGLKYTDDQQAKIDEIHKNMKVRLDAVVNDKKLGPDQKGAMIQGYQRMERSAVFKVLTPEQQMIVSKRVRARRAAAQEEYNKKQQAQKARPN